MKSAHRMLGVCSVTFRKLSPEEVIGLTAETGLDAIEWGGDIHVPPGKLGLARDLKAAMEAAGLRTFSYGSYFTLGPAKRGEYSFQDVVDTAATLSAGSIRIWAGNVPAAQADGAYFDAVIREARQLGDLAHRAGIDVSLEVHSGSLTDSVAACEQLLNAIDHPQIGCHWQPTPALSLEENLAGLRRLLPWMHHLHVFTWNATPNGLQRRPLGEGEAMWRQVLAMTTVPAFLEFVADDDPQQFRKDAAMLRMWRDELT